MSNRTISEHQPIHGFFGLTYGTHLVLPRSVLQSMPVEWQREFVKLMHEYADATAELDIPNYQVTARVGNKFAPDPFNDYERGRRRVELVPPPTATGED
jgi:hypothetical protein